VEEDLQAECPCHGSRFAGDGTVLNPPAVTDLQAYPASIDASGNVTISLFAGDGVFPPLTNGQIVFKLSDHPALLSAGGAVVGHPDGLSGPLLVTRPDASLNVVALFALCTHLQCTVLPDQGKLHCPCHGSEFTLQGVVTHGPATFNLDVFPSTVDAAGTVTITVPPAGCP
jgi:Rieske Fe-S protein